MIFGFLQSPIALRSLKGFVALRVGLAILLTAATLSGQDQVSPSDQSEPGKRTTVFWPENTACNPDITSPKEFFGFDIGQRHLRHDQVVAYLRQIAGGKRSDRFAGLRKNSRAADRCCC